MNILNLIKNTIVENVDALYKDNNIVQYTSKNTYPFLYDGTNIAIGNESTGHDEMKKEYGKNLDQGRIWVDYKTISFWDDIKIDRLLNLIKKLETNLNLKISDDWIIEYNGFDIHSEVTTTLGNMKQGIESNIPTISKDEFKRRIEKSLYSRSRNKSLDWDSDNNLRLRQAKYRGG